MYSIEITAKAEKFLNKLPKSEAALVLQKIYSIRESPFSHLKRLKGNDFWRLRVHKYRAIIDVVVSGKKLIVLRIGHRKNIYDE